MEKPVGTPSLEKTAVAQPVPRTGEGFLKIFRNNEFILFVVVMGLLVIGGIVNPNFLKLDNLKIISRDAAILAIGAVGVMFPILTGGIDLSIGSIVGLMGVLTAQFIINYNIPIWISMLMVLAIAILIGSYHGLFVTKLKMHGFLITLVTFGLARGLALVITNSFPITGLPDAFNVLGQGYAFNVIPIPVIICALVSALAYYLLRYSFVGRQIYAAGGNIEAARFSGVNVDARIILCYIFSVVCATLVAFILDGRLTMGHPGSGEGFELQAITACILGGVSFAGGEGGVVGVLFGAAMIGVLQNEMIMLDINVLWHKVVISLVLLAAITLDYVRRRRRV